MKGGGGGERKGVKGGLSDEGGLCESWKRGVQIVRSEEGGRWCRERVEVGMEMAVGWLIGVKLLRPRTPPIALRNSLLKTVSVNRTLRWIIVRCDALSALGVLLVYTVFEREKSNGSDEKSVEQKSVLKRQKD